MKRNKFSIIIPVYNVGKYIEKCFNSVIGQTYNNYECILICDKSTDESTQIAKKYSKKYNFKFIYKENTGLSEARNIGVDASNGEYILFLDADDYIENDLLEKMNSIISNQDIIRYQVREIRNNKKIDWKEESTFGTGIECFENIINFHYVENAWAYCYNSEFYKKKRFKFMKGCIAEDFGLIPLIIAKAKKMSVISYIGYNYVQRENSLMSNTNYNKKIIKMEDLLKQYKFLESEMMLLENNELFMRFINNSLIYFSTTLKYRDYKKYNRILKKENIYDYLPKDNLKQKIRSFVIRFNPYIYHNYISRFL